MTATTAADAILVERAQQDFDEGLAHARERIRARHGRFVGASLDAIMLGAVNVLHLRSQMREDVRFLLALAHRVADGEDPTKLAEENLARVLRLKQGLHLVVRLESPPFQRVLDIARDNFARRLPDLALMATVPDPHDYGDLVRKAFPDRAHVEAIVRENQTLTHAVVDQLEAHPEVLRIARPLIPKVAESAREVIDWQTGKVLRGVDEIYAKA